MSRFFYSKLALTNMKNNRKTYIPYLFTCVMTIMMFYIMDALAGNKNVGDGNLRLILNYAVGVIIIFSVIFLFYTNSFLIKRRKRELGVYNILGMEKRHIAKMLSLETFFTALISLAAGLIGGLIFSKLMYLALLKILHYDINMTFEISPDSLVKALLLFGVIFFATLLYNLFQVQSANPVELLRGSSQGEKEPKTKWIMTVFGIVMLGIGYYIAVTTESPLSALMLFFVAVVCVILGTYALFTAGSIALLKILRKNKNFYYKTNHFTSISGMIYRMKQNAVGLANICILSTMVLVMVSTTISLYVGMDDVLKTRFQRENSITKYMADDESMKEVDRLIDKVSDKYNVEAGNPVKYRSGSLSVIKKGNSFALASDSNYNAEDAVELEMIPLDDYNIAAETDITLRNDEILLFTNTIGNYGKDTITIDGRKLHVQKELKELFADKKSESQVIETFYIVSPNIGMIDEFLKKAYGSDEDYEMMTQMQYTYSFDLKGDKKQCVAAMKSINKQSNDISGARFECREISRQSFYMLYGGLLFIGIYLGVMFLMATVLIIYYKQISEGYDDKDRYQIMQKVGMSKKEVRHSIRSQVLTVFFLPLVAAIIHIAVAFKVITKLLAVLNLVNVTLFLICTIVTVAVFAVFYAVVFGVTAREYYKIVQ